MSKRPTDEVLEAPPAGVLSLSGKVALVTGASSGIGRAIALAFAAAGADVAVTYRANRGGANETAEGVRTAGRRVEAICTDVAQAADVEALGDTLRRSFGRVDVWVNNAGADILTGEAAPLSRVEKLDRLLGVDLRGTAAAKGGVYSFSRALARAAAPQIRVNVIGPGWIETAYGNELDPAVKQRIAAKIPLGRWGTPEEIAHAAVYLASDAAGYVTGQMLMINGGSVV
ncbi:MAG: hypothetical protein DMD61_04795 [Gemmatimonadetes bacterium]|nr:MAG: hypothetical protein DMD61_04795 [Gemmatimonadota bacterium]